MIKEAITIVFVLASVSFCAYGQAADGIGRSADEKEILRSIAEIGSAFKSRSAEPFEQLYLENFINIRDRPNHNYRKQLIAMMKADAAALRSGVKLDFKTLFFKADPVSVKTFGTAAIVTATKQNQWAFKGAECLTRNQNTELWVKRDGRWKVLASQTATFPCSPMPFTPLHPAVAAIPVRTLPLPSPDSDAELGIQLAFNRLRVAAIDGPQSVAEFLPEDFVWTDATGRITTDIRAFTSSLVAKVDQRLSTCCKEFFYAESDAGLASFRAIRKNGDSPTPSEELVQLTVFFVKLNGEWRPVAGQATSLGSIEGSLRRLADDLIAKDSLLEAQAVLDLVKEKEFRVTNSSKDAEMIPYRNAEPDLLAKIENLASLTRRQAELQKEKDKRGGRFAAEKQAELSKIFDDIELANNAFRLAMDTLPKAERGLEDRVADIKTERNLQRTLSELGREIGTDAVAIYTVVSTDEAEKVPDNEETRKKFGWVILVTPSSRKAYQIDVTGLNELVSQFRRTLSSDKYDPQPVAAKLYDKIFRHSTKTQKATLEQDLNTYLGGRRNSTIIWSLDGVLRYVPMAALYDGKGYLVERYEHVAFTKQSHSLLHQRDVSRWRVLGLGVSEARSVDGGDGSRLRFSALAGAKRELMDIVREAKEKTGIFEGTRRLDRDFTKESALNLMRDGTHPVIHIASHYHFNSKEQTSSFLVAGDGKISFAEMQDKDNLFGTVDLLTLSACDTGVGGNGKEAEGFAYLAQSLGAKSVLASLWEISDSGTPELMVRFYRLKANDPNITKGEAFRRAQLSLLHGEEGAGIAADRGTRSEIVTTVGGTDGGLRPFLKDPKRPFAHPHYWASFVLIGNWR